MTHNVSLGNEAVMTHLWLYGLLVLMGVVIVCLLYKLHELRSKGVKERDYHRFLFDILDNLPFPVMVKDIENGFKYAYWNKESELQSGIKCEDAVGRSDYDIYGKERGRYYRAVDEDLVKIGKPYRAEEHYVTTDGVDHDTIVMKSIFSRGVSGKWLLVTRWEISQLKRYERELLIAKNQLESAIKKQNLALKSIDFGLIYIDKDYRVQWEETTHLKNLVSGRHYTPGMICYRTSALRDQPCEHCAFKEAIEQKRIVRHTVRVEDVDFEVTGTPVYADDNKEVIGGLLRFEDITEKLKLDQALREAKEKAEESNRLKSAFLANMSHEIRTPLNSIVGFSDLLKDIEAFSPEEVKQFVDTINTNCTLLLALINDILDLSRIESGSMDFRFAGYNLTFVMQQIYDSQRLSMPRGVELVMKLPEGEGKSIVTDSVRLKQVINNFINNAKKFTTQGSITFGFQTEEPGHTVFFVEDTGSGISEENQRRIFERFYKVDSFTQGAGLGLSICQTIVERFRGEINVSSELGKGTRFTVRVPDFNE